MAEETVGEVDPDVYRGAIDSLTRFMMPYKFGLAEVLTKVNILREELTYTHDHNPIEHVKSRLKSAESLAAKARRLGCEHSPEDMQAQILDAAGVRITCTFITDVYDVAAMLSRQEDLTVIRTRDYIAQPKLNGYKSLHLIVSVPVFLSDRVKPVCVEVQLRTVAMDFWASLEHKARYKYRGTVPSSVADELRRAGEVTTELDESIERLRADILDPPLR